MNARDDAVWAADTITQQKAEIEHLRKILRDALLRIENNAPKTGSEAMFCKKTARDIRDAIEKVAQ